MVELQSLKMKDRQHMVKIWTRPSRDGLSYAYYLRYIDLYGKRKCVSLGHSDLSKAKKQQAKKEKELRMGYCPPESMRLKDFVEKSLARTGDTIRESTREEYESVAKDFIKIVGNIDFQAVTLELGEYYRQVCLDIGNRKATVTKKLKHLKHLFQLAVNRKQLDENPFQNIDIPKTPKNKTIRIYSETECKRMLLAAKEYMTQKNMATTPQWDLLILTALETGCRRGELLNLCWSDIDFEEEQIDICGKDEADETWEWCIKDADDRTVPLGKYTIRMLIELQNTRPTGYPYVFVPTARYDFIQKERAKGNWSYSDSRLKVVNNFYRQFEEIMTRAHIKKKGTFHDLRRTAISNWFAQGLTRISHR